jgi:hypothetical protein
MSAARSFSVLAVWSLLFAVVAPVADLLAVELGWLVEVAVAGLDQVTFVPSA